MSACFESVEMGSLIENWWWESGKALTSGRHPREVLKDEVRRSWAKWDWQGGVFNFSVLSPGKIFPRYLQDFLQQNFVHCDLQSTFYLKLNFLFFCILTSFLLCFSPWHMSLCDILLINFVYCLLVGRLHEDRTFFILLCSYVTTI